MDPSDYYNEAMVSEPMEVVAGVSEAEGASTLEVAAGGQGGDVLGRIGGPVAAVLEKAVVGTLARAVRAELGKVLVSILKLKIILNIIYKVPPLLLNLCKKCCIYVNNCK